MSSATVTDNAGHCAMESIADMGGTQGWGRVPRPRGDEPVFGEPWQGRAFALTLMSIWAARQNVHSFRHAQERLSRAAYLDDGYFARWLNAAELLLTDTAILAPGAIDARARNLRGEAVAEPPVPEPALPDFVPTAEGSLRTIDSAPAFAVGQRVRSKDYSPPGHTRLPRYARGHAGVIEAIRPAEVLPDTMADLRGENPQYVYSVRYDARELWGADAEPFALTAEEFESYLEPVS